MLIESRSQGHAVRVRLAVTQVTVSPLRQRPGPPVLVFGQRPLSAGYHQPKLLNRLTQIISSTGREMPLDCT